MKQATIANYSSMDVFCGTASPPNSTSVCPDIIQKYDINVSQVFRTTVHLLPAHYFELRCVNEFCIRSSYLLTLYRILESIFIGADKPPILLRIKFILKQSLPCSYRRSLFTLFLLVISFQHQCRPRPRSRSSADYQCGSVKSQSSV